MNGHVRSVGREEAIGVKQGAGEVEALLDVGGKGGALKASPHFLDKCKETIGKQFTCSDTSEAGGIQFSSFAHGNLFEQKAAAIPYPSPPTRLKKKGAERIGNENRPIEDFPRHQGVAKMERRTRRTVLNSLSIRSRIKKAFNGIWFNLNGSNDAQGHDFDQAVFRKVTEYAPIPVFKKRIQFG